jgi:malate dehydrogenase (oxaloacetate-decarboxylating)
MGMPNAKGVDQKELINAFRARSCSVATKPSEDVVRLHPLYRGKVQVLPKCPIRGLSDFSIWYMPGVAASCKVIQANRKHGAH